MAGTLYLCATPIGNLEDITFRVLRTLKEVDLIAAEDTRHSIKLLNHFDIKTPMTSYHEYNKVDKARYLVGQLEEGVDIALITDAGTPGISDPGEELVRQCYEAGIQVTSLPGPAACITALTMSGLVSPMPVTWRFLLFSSISFSISSSFPCSIPTPLSCTVTHTRSPYGSAVTQMVP